VQYRESGFNFISRLLEQDGIFYFFEHEKDKHTLVLADAPSIHKPCPNQTTATYLPEGGWGEFDNPVTSWEIKNELRPGKYTLRDFHMQMPSKTLEVLEPTKFNVGNNGNLEVYDYPGEYARRFNKKERQGEVESEATKLVKMRMEEEETPYEQIHAASLCRGFTPGFNFKLNGHFDRGVNAKYVLTSIEHVAVQSPWYIAEETDKRTDEPYHNTFTAIPDDVPFRPARKTRKPLVPGTQTAIVVGPSGEEIWTDEFSRIKVQFHWDRKGKKDAKSSCWIRVATNWAGKQWGMIIIPRIGQEVIVDFLEGDPDQPIIIGSVYNADMMPPYSLPDQDTQTGIKTHSTKDGTPSNFNEIRFEDKKGSEELYIHAEKDKVVVVEHNRTESVGNDESISIRHDRTESVDNNETINITANRTETVGKNETISIGENRALTVEKNEDITINQNETIEIGKNREESVGQDSTMNIGKNFTLNAGDSITLKTGAAELNMQKDGTIVLKGKDITIQGSGAITVKASQTITMKGSKVLQN
jgi:type VI secretion system secreted protein VgrG